ncbi:MAG: GTPase domain-containing protein [Actinomycetaceae bacterium]|nr:GTPase domain-containing protein [Actinomycetaceae bacterium]
MVEISSLTKLSEALKDLRFVFSQPDFTAADAQRTRVIHKLDNHVLPRLRNLEAPLICVVAGSTGSGKSTLVNSLLETNVATSSAVRPTTRRPLLLHSVQDTQWFKAGSPILPQLAKVEVAAEAPPTPAHVGTHQEIEIRTNAKLPAGLALLDAPDFDSLATENRVLARQLLDVADMWVFVTTATRYADAVPWEVLREAKARNITLAVVLNRTPLAAAGEVSTDLSRLLTEAGLENLPLWVIPEVSLESGRIPPSQVQPLLRWLDSHTLDSHLRIATAMRALLGTARVLTADARAVRQVASKQQELLTEARLVAHQQIEKAVEQVSQASANGSLLQGEVLARWQELVGVSELSQLIEKGLSLFKFKVKSFFTGQKPQVESVEVALESGLAAVIAAELLAAQRRLRGQWQASPYLQVFAEQMADFSPAQIESQAQRLTIRWQRELLEMIRSEGGSKRTTARVMAAGVNLLGVALMIVIFASTGGLTGAELGVAGTTSVVAQKLLEVIFGEQAVKSMTKRAHVKLVELVAEFYSQEFTTVVQAIPEPVEIDALTAAIFGAEATVRELEFEVRSRLGERL